MTSTENELKGKQTQNKTTPTKDDQKQHYTLQGSWLLERDKNKDSWCKQEIFPFAQHLSMRDTKTLKLFLAISE